MSREITVEVASTGQMADGTQSLLIRLTKPDWNALGGLSCPREVTLTIPDPPEESLFKRLMVGDVWRERCGCRDLTVAHRLEEKGLIVSVWGASDAPCTRCDGPDRVNAGTFVRPTPEPEAQECPDCVNLEGDLRDDACDTCIIQRTNWRAKAEK